ncbi:MAG TPA: PadR family transcriptional regulator, partial [Clostridiales bacterium]|nr:PadR family transcriptional regulator [Clostridiales bacterium]
CLYNEPNHGYGIMQETANLTKDRVKIGSGTMYGAVSNMLKKKWITEFYSNKPEDNRKRLYQITDEGKKIIKNERKRLKELLDCSEVIMGGDV